ncbi:MAG: RluA family pseudouridine synthase [Myxococcales bacterium]|nr:MAG: RluA family pseudouridine synthase [Myxococcales bacterium]
MGRRRVRRWLEFGLVRVDGRRVKAGQRLTAGAVVVVDEGDDNRAATATELRGEQPRIVWTEGSLIVVAKPAGFHSVRGKEGPSVADYLAARFPQIEGVGAEGECGLVHRLDRDTSGALLATNDPDRYRMLREAFAAGKVRKRYLALVNGAVAADFDVNQPLAREYTKVRPVRAQEAGRRAETRVEPLEGGADWSLVRCEMLTGVTHQIRAHLAFAGHAVIGDSKYGENDRQIATPVGSDCTRSQSVWTRNSRSRSRQPRTF